MTHEFAGELETHLTVAAGDDRALAALRDWADARGMKCVHIVLAAGATPSQPMVTRRATGTLASELAVAHGLGDELAAAGFRVVRVKIEAAPGNPGVPATDEEARRAPHSRHFEHHVKLLLPATADLASLARTAERRGGRLSRNAFKTRADGAEERFVTQRCHAVGRETARRRLAELLDDLASHRTLDVEAEYVIHDSRAALDAGWLDAE